MWQKVAVRQYSNFQIEFRATDPEGSEPEGMKTVETVYDLDPYNMLLASLGACTTIVLHTYAHNRGINLEQADITLEYKRNFKEDCENCENIEQYDELIEQRLSLKGDFTPEQKKKLDFISEKCSIHKMLESGIKIRSLE